MIEPHPPRIAGYKVPAALAGIVALTRIPFFAHTLFEFDSVNYAVALFRFDLAQDTPHLPGYLLHVGIGKLLFALVGDANLAYVLEAFFLSLGSVLLVWWALRSIVAPGAAFIAAAVWALNPIFWFYGCVASGYAHEAFFTSAVAAIAVRYCIDIHHQRSRVGWPVAMGAVIGLAGAARQTSLMFLAPALIVALWSMKAPLRAWLMSLGVMALVTAVWVAILLTLAGGWSRYIELTHSVTIVQYNSIFLHGTLTRHLDMIGKMLLYLVIGTAPLWSLLGYAFVRRPRAAWHVCRRDLRSPLARTLVTIILVPLAFYTLFFYAKPGYLLNIFSASTIGTALLVQQLRNAGITLELKRWGAAWAIVWTAYFTAPMPGKSVDAIHQQEAIASTSFDVSHRFPTISDKIRAVGVKAFSYASSAGIAAFDQENTAVLGALNALGSSEDAQVLICSRWGQWGMFYRPASTVYDFALTPDKIIPAYVEQGFVKKEITDSIVHLPESARDVVLLMWDQHWAFRDVQRQVNLAKLNMPPYLDAWRITDAHFRLKLGGITLVR